MELVKKLFPTIVIEIIIIYVIMKAVKQSKNCIETDIKTYFTEVIALGVELGASFGISLERFWDYKLA